MLRIRTAVESEAAVVVSIIRRAFLEQVERLGLREAEHPNYVGFETEPRVLSRMAAGGHAALAERGDESIGTVSWALGGEDATSGDIMRLAVLPPYRRSGHGRELMAHAEAQLMAAGASVARLSIVAQFRRLEEYYQQMGYAVVSMRRVPSLPFELSYMEKQLREPL